MVQKGAPMRLHRRTIDGDICNA